MKKYFFSVMLGIFAISFLQSQIKIGNNPQNIDASSVLELESNSRVLVITRMSAAQMNSITPLQGALVYNTDEACVFYFDGAAWLNLCEEGIFNTNFEVVGEELVLTDSQGDTVSVPLSDLGVVTFSADPVFNPVDNDNTIVITETGDNVNIEVGEITGFNIVDSSINGFLDIQDGSIVSSKLQDDSVDRSKIAANVAGIGLTQAPDGSLDVDVTEFSGEGVLSSPTNTLTISGDPANALFNSVGLDVADNAITQVKMADNAIGTAEIINDAVTTDKILDASITNGKLDKPTIPISGFAPAAANVDFGNNRLLNVVDPVDITDVANKNYVDNAVGGLSNLADGTIYIGDAGNQAQEIAISGDATMDNAGVLTIEPDAVGTAEIIDANITNAKLDKVNIPLSGFGDAAADVALGGFQLKNVAEPTDAQDAATKNYVDNSIASSNALANTNIFVGSATGVATGVAMGGDATINNAGVLTIEPDAIETNEIADNAVTSAKINDGEIIDADVSGTAAIAGTKINPDFGSQNIITTGTVTVGASTITAAAGTNGQILTNDGVGNATWQNPAPLAVATTTALDGDGLAATPLDLADNAVTSAKIVDGEIVDADVANTAAITGTKINPDFGAQNISSTGTLASGNTTITGTLSTTGTATVGANTITAVDGTNGQVLTTDGAGNATWQNTAPLAVASTTAFNGDGLAATPLDLADNAVTSAKIADGEIVDADVANTAAITGTKINPDFGAQNISSTGTLASGNTTITGTLSTTGTVTVGANTITATDGTNGQVLTTDGAGNATWQNSAEATITATAGSVFFANGSNGATEDNAQLFWDDTNNRLGVGVNSGLANKLTVGGSTRTSGLQNSNGTAGLPSYRFTNNLDTGMYLEDPSGILAFSTNDNRALRIDATQNVIIDTNLELEGTLTDSSGNAGTSGQVLSSTGTGTQWVNSSNPTKAVGKINANGSVAKSNLGTGIVTHTIGSGVYTVNVSSLSLPDANYTIQLTLLGATSGTTIQVINQTITEFTVEISEPVVIEFSIDSGSLTIVDGTNTPTGDSVASGTNILQNVFAATNNTDASWYFTILDF